MQETYQKVAELFVSRINQIFESEDTLKVEFERQFPKLEFSRTDHWSGILYVVLRECWYEAGPAVQAEPTGYDRLAILKAAHPLLDYNLFTQVCLNLQAYTGMAYQTKDAEKELERLKEEWPKDERLNPFEPKAKMLKQATSDIEKRFNHTLSTMRSLKIISAFTPQISFRVSPKGSTPAFADSRNISMIGVGGDQYLKTIPSLRAFYIHWAPGTSPFMTSIVLTNYGPGTSVPPKFRAEDIPYDFSSRSGGDMLQEVLFARKIMYEVFAAHDVLNEVCIMIPRINSVLIVADKYGYNLRKAFDSLKQRYPMIELSEGARGLIS